MFSEGPKGRMHFLPLSKFCCCQQSLVCGGVTPVSGVIISVSFSYMTPVALDCRPTFVQYDLILTNHTCTNLFPNTSHSEILGRTWIWGALFNPVHAHPLPQCFWLSETFLASPCPGESRISGPGLPVPRRGAWRCSLRPGEAQLLGWRGGCWDGGRGPTEG